MSHFREGPRRQILLPVRYRVGDALMQSGSTKDVGLKGCFVCLHPSKSSEDLPAEGGALLVMLTTPTAWDALSLPATVCWTSDKPLGFGVHFDSLSASQGRALSDLLAASAVVGAL